MKKTLLLLAILCATVFSVQAQTDNVTKFSAGFDLGVPIGTASNAYEATIGTSFKLEVPVASPLNLTLTAGYTGYITKGGFSTGYDSYSGSYTYGAIASFIPVEAGAKVYVSRLIFIEGDLGASFNINSDHASYTGKNVALIYAPIAGVSIPIRSSSVDVSLRYESRVEAGSDYSQLAVRAAFSFGL